MWGVVEMSEFAKIPDDLPRNINLKDAEQALESFGYEIVLQPIPKQPTPKAPLGFGHKLSDQK